MRLADCHTHLFTAECLEAYGEPYRRCAERYRHARVSHFGGSPENPIPVAESVRHWRESGFAKVIVLNLNAGARYKRSLSTEKFVALLAEHRDLCIPFASVDPRCETSAARELREAIVLHGCAGLKIHPSYQEVYPNDRHLLYPLYEICAEFRIPVLLHTGSTLLHRTPLKYSQPLFVDDVAVDFPDLPLIMAHAGWPWVEEAIAIAWRHENVYLDLSGHLPKHLPPLIWHYMQVPDLSRRFLFGSDYPFLLSGALLTAYREFTAWHCPLCNKKETWRDGMKENFLGENLLRLLEKR